MKRILKLLALAIAGACIPLYAYISGVNDATEEHERCYDPVSEEEAADQMLGCYDEDNFTPDEEEEEEPLGV